MWTGRELERKVARALDCIGKGAAALSEAGTTVFHMSNAMQKQGLADSSNLDGKTIQMTHLQRPSVRRR